MSSKSNVKLVGVESPQACCHEQIFFAERELCIAVVMIVPQAATGNSDGRRLVLTNDHLTDQLVTRTAYDLRSILNGCGKTFGTGAAVGATVLDVSQVTLD